MFAFAAGNIIKAAKFSAIFASRLRRFKINDEKHFGAEFKEKNMLIYAHDYGVLPNEEVAVRLENLLAAVAEIKDEKKIILMRVIIILKAQSCKVECFI